MIVEGVVRRVGDRPENAPTSGAPTTELVDLLVSKATGIADAVGL